MKYQSYIRLKRAIQVLRETYPDFPIPMVLVFLELIQNPDGMTVSQVEKATGLTQASASRHCRALTAQKSPREPGLGLANIKPDPNDFRSKYFFLNYKGWEVARKLEEAFEI